jgi:hypothetical protein
MFVFTHALLPVVLSAPALPRTSRRDFQIATAAVALSGAMPDLLTPHLSLAARYASWSHSVFAWAAFSALMLLVARRWLPLRVCGFAALAYGLHLAGDAIAGGIAWAYPVAHDVIARRWIPYRFWLPLDVVMLAITVLLYAQFAPPPAPTLKDSNKGVRP